MMGRGCKNNKKLGTKHVTVDQISPAQCFYVIHAAQKENKMMCRPYISYTNSSQQMHVSMPIIFQQHNSQVYKVVSTSRSHGGIAILYVFPDIMQNKSIHQFTVNSPSLKKTSQTPNNTQSTWNDRKIIHGYN